MAIPPTQAVAGMTAEEVRSFEGYKAKAFEGDPLAQFNLGKSYANGTGVAKDEVEAVKWYRKAAEQGFAQAQTNLGVCFGNGTGVAKDEVEAVKWWLKAAKQGFASAQFNLGNRYSNGTGVAKDDVEAYAYWNLAGVTFEDARKNLANLEKTMTTEARLAGQKRTKELQREIEAKRAGK